MGPDNTLIGDLYKKPPCAALIAVVPLSSNLFGGPQDTYGRHQVHSHDSHGKQAGQQDIQALTEARNQPLNSVNLTLSFSHSKI